MQQNNIYNDVKLSQFKMWLRDMDEKSNKLWFEVYVDDIKVVPITDRIDSLDDHKIYLDEDSNTVKVFTYNTERSNRYTQYTFTIEKKKKEGSAIAVSSEQHGLSGLELENKINDRVAQHLIQERERWTNEQMKRDYEELKKKLQDADEYIDELQTELVKYKSKKMLWGDVNLGEVASVIVEGMVKRNPHWVAKLPGGDALAGLIAKEATENGTAEVIENEVVIKKKTPTDERLSDEAKTQIAFLAQLEEKFDQVQLDKIMMILQFFVQHPASIETVFELLEIKK